MNKKGVSTIIVTVIMITIVLAAIGVVWVMIQNILEQGAEDISVASARINLDVQNVKVTEDGVDVQVRRNKGEGNLVGLKFIVSDGIGTEIFEEPTTISELGTQKFSLPYTGFVKSVEVAPILQSAGGKNATGQVVENFDNPRKDIYLEISEKTCSELGWVLGGATAECGDDIGCIKDVNWEETKNACENAGARLCTKDEILANAVAGSGCGFDSYMIWTNTECGLKGFYLVDGNPLPNEFYCEEDLSSITSSQFRSSIGVRCCGDN